MRVIQIVFSPTGGTKRAADLLTAGLGKLVQTVDLTDNQFQPMQLSGIDTCAVIAMPSYGGRVPALAAYRLKDIQAQGMPCVLLCVYGNRAFEDTLVEMEDLARTAGFEPAAAVAAVAEHSIMHQFAAGRPDAADTRNLKEYGGRIAQKLAGPWEKGALPIPGNRPYKAASGVPLVPKGDSSCVNCGTCAKQCPAGAINPSKPRETDKKLCIACMRCIAICPQKARKVNGAMVSVAAMAIKKACEVRKECELWM